MNQVPPYHTLFLQRFACCTLASIALLGCATNVDETPPIQDISSILTVFESVRAEFGLPKARLGLQETQMFAYAGEGSHLVLDEQFAGQLSDAALRYVLIHELEHLRNKDPRNGYDILKKLHQDQGGTGDTKFLTLVGIHGLNPEFQAYVAQAEKRANEVAVQYTRDRGDDPCEVIREIERITKVRFTVGVDSACVSSQTPEVQVEALPPAPPSDDNPPSWEEPLPFGESFE